MTEPHLRRAAAPGELADLMKRLNDEARSGCGLSYELFAMRLSSLVDAAAAELRPGLREPFMVLATEGGVYLTPAQVEGLMSDFSADGFCEHGIERGCCPRGCE